LIDSRTQTILSETLTLAKQLGAIVFTYNGEDVPKTILQFVKEYRVGHVVIGSPAPMPFWKRLLGKKSLVEHLIFRSQGITIVVLDTRQASLSAFAEKETAPGQGEKALEHSVTGQAFRLTSILSPDKIVRWENPTTKRIVLQELINRLASNIDAAPETILSELLRRETESSTFFNNGVAFPHVRIDGLKHPLVSLGITPCGIEDVPFENPVRLVFLILSPKEDPNLQLRILGMVSRLARNENFVEQMLQCDSAESAWIAIVNMEKDSS
jgi:two-component system sensor histidine kinase KdpD